jgi:hypothetical protein
VNRLLLDVLIQLAMIVVLGGFVAYMAENEVNMRRKDRIVYYGSNVALVCPLLREAITRHIGSDVKKYAFVELGGGLAKISQSVADLGWRQMLAVDWAPIISTVGRLRVRALRLPITYSRGSLFEIAAETPAVIYCYLSTEILERLSCEGRFDGALVFSLTFAVADAIPVETIRFKTWQSPLYIYDFRGRKPSRVR